MTDLEDQHRVESWMRPGEIHLRQNARDYLNKAVELQLLLDNNVQNVKAFSQGESSVVFRVYTESNTYVVKMRGDDEGLEAEASFLNAWEKQGVKVPHIYSVRSANKDLPVSILVMEFINAPILSKSMSTNEMVKKGITRELGRTLARMHEATGTGFGFSRKSDELTGIFGSLTEEIDQTLFGKHTNWLIQKGVITERDVEIARKATKILEEDIRNGTKPTLTHNDFRPYNMFATEPITIFDPDPRITHPAIDLAYSTLKPLINKPASIDEKDEFLAGYREIHTVDDRILAAATVLRGVRKLHTWQRKGRTGQVKKLREVINRNQKLILY